MTNLDWVADLAWVDEEVVLASGGVASRYFDARRILAYPAARYAVTVALVSKLLAKADAIVGVATGGIPWATSVADMESLPLLYVRDKPKPHGMRNVIEGEYHRGWIVILIDDVRTTGRALIKAKNHLIGAGMLVLQILTVKEVICGD